MAASLPPLNCAPPLSNKQRKAASRKERRKRKRQAIARARECDAQNGAIVDPNEEMDKEDDDDASFVLERQRLHDEWLERERLAQEEFLLRSEREEAARKRREDDERKIKEEWEAQQRREEQQKEQKQQEKRDREEAVQKMLDEAENQLTNGGPWMNPEAPVPDKSQNYGTERDAANCPFFLKTGSCRFGDRCSRKHVYPSTSPTLMIRAMFITYGMEQSQRDDYDGDASLEHSEEDLHESFTEFYHDVLPEFKTVGKVVQFKVSCNYEPHLRGNVYVQFDTEEQCRQAFIKFNGRWYAGKQLHCEICPVTRWKNAICGLFDRKKCPKGKHCNFLHVFRNPGNEFWEADRDLHLSPDHSIKRSQSERHSERYSDRHSERRGDRSRRSHWSRSPPRSERSYGKREDDRRSERSRDRRTSQHQRDDSRRSFRSARYDRASDRYPSRSREKSRSRSRDRKRSRDQDRNVKSPNKGEEKDRNGDTERNKPGREKSKRHSPENEDEKRRPDEDSKTRRRHKHSKKSKKKSKKKHKKRSCSPEGTTSSRESEDETEEKGERSQNNEDLSANPSIDAENSSITQVDEHTQSCS